MAQRPEIVATGRNTQKARIKIEWLILHCILSLDAAIVSRNTGCVLDSAARHNIAFPVYIRFLTEPQSPTVNGNLACTP
jgi:hypothetical protein